MMVLSEPKKLSRLYPVSFCGEHHEPFRFSWRRPKPMAYLETITRYAGLQLNGG